MKDKTEKYYANGENLRFTMISAEEEKRLFRLAKNWESGEEEAIKAREFLITNNLLWTAQFAKRLAKGRLPEDEVISAGNLALMTAVARFDPELGFRFRSYLGPFIRGAISSLWKSKNPVDYKHNFPKEPTGVGFLRPLVDLIVDHPFEGEEYREHIIKILNECLKILSEREILLIRQVCKEGKSFAEIGRSRGVSRAAPQATFARICQKLRDEFHRHGIEELGNI